MSELQANLEAIARLRETLVGFIYAQREALESANNDIHRAFIRLEEARQHWQNRVDICTERALECYRVAAWAAAQGDSMDCSCFTSELERAEERLERVVSAQDHLQRAVEEYEGAHYRLAGSLDHDAARSITYLDALLDGMEAYLAVRIFSATGVTPEKLHRGPDLPVLPAEGPMTPPERREGDYGGPERRG